jgi:phage terminase small subunit
MVARVNRKPIELHLLEGTKPAHDAVQLPDSVKSRVPVAEWMENPAAWNKVAFIKETSDFLWESYGIGSKQDRHTLAILADQIDLYIKCSLAIEAEGLVSENNGGKTVGANAHLSIRNKATTLIIQLMNELGLTPRGRLSGGKVESQTKVGKFLQGPIAK